MFKPRPAQAKVLAYKSGTMGIAAVPGSGKTWTLSQLAASLIINGLVGENEEVLIVTLVNSAVDNFKKRIAFFLEEQGYISGIGYKVRTLHGLAHEIISKVPSAVGLANDFSVVDDRTADELLKAAFRASYPRYEKYVQDYLIKDLSAFRQKKIISNDLPNTMQSVMRSAISHLKNRKITSPMLRQSVADTPFIMGHLVADVYERYQHGLATRGALDFDDLITTALRCLEQDATLVEEFQTVWPFILEDEAQDSSALQEGILRLLVGKEGNWVRVGDPNQAIYETFTTAHPKYLRRFLQEAKARQNLPNSGRSGEPIIELANELIRWTKEEHPVLELRDALAEPFIEPTPPGDPQPNPPRESSQRAIIDLKDDPDDERQRVVKSIKKWLPDHADSTVAVLVPTHSHGAELIKILKNNQVPFSDALLPLTTQTREAAGALSSILNHLTDPARPGHLIKVYRVWFFRVLKNEKNEENQNFLDEHIKWLKECPANEALIWPMPGADWLLDVSESMPQHVRTYLEQFKEQMQVWHKLVALPFRDILTALSQDLFDQPEKLAMTQLFCDEIHRELHLKKLSQTINELPLQLADYRAELTNIAQGKRRLRSIEADKSGFDPDAHKGEVVVATMHGAKGLEWDRVYLVSVNDYEFPSGLDGDQFRAERWFIRDKLSMEAEVLAQVDAMIDETAYQEGAATHEARLDYARERLRLLYVGITRARKELMITTNIGRGKNKPAEAFIALKTFIDKSHATA